MHTPRSTIIHEKSPRNRIEWAPRVKVHDSRGSTALLSPALFLIALNISQIDSQLINFLK